MAAEGVDVEETVLLYAPTVRHKARTLGYGPGDAEYDSVVSDGLLALWRAVESHDPARGPLAAHIATQIQRGMVDGLRSRGVFGRPDRGRPAAPTAISLGERDDGPAIDDVEESASARDLIDRAGRADPRLPEILTMRAAGLTNTEIAGRVGLSRPGVCRLLGLARRAVAA